LVWRDECTIAECAVWFINSNLQPLIHKSLAHNGIQSKRKCWFMKGMLHFRIQESLKPVKTRSAESDFCHSLTFISSTKSRVSQLLRKVQMESIFLRRRSSFSDCHCWEHLLNEFQSLHLVNECYWVSFSSLYESPPNVASLSLPIKYLPRSVNTPFGRWFPIEEEIMISRFKRLISLELEFSYRMPMYGTKRYLKTNCLTKHKSSLWLHAEQRISCDCR
jgi:hypothetical protein